MKQIMRVLTCAGVLTALSLATAQAQETPRYAHTGPTLVAGVRLIDGLGNAPVENQDILIADGKIARIGPGGTLEAPDGAITIDGKGMTAIPGLIDMHIHLQGSWAHGNIEGEKYAIRYDDEAIQQRLSGYLYAGVTTLF
jgi:imidazolonepropionase-like amidohydrolase